MRRIAVINQKGGVGKTTTCANLGAALARLGRRVVLVDMDAQANLSMHLGVEVGETDPSSYSVLVGKSSFAAALRSTRTPDLWLVPSHLELSGAELELASAFGRETLLRVALEDWEREARAQTGAAPADYVIFDCPPSLGLLSINALAAANEVLIALQTEFFALQGMSTLVDVVQLLQRRLHPSLEITGILPCLYDSRKKLAREVLAEIRNYFPGKVLRTNVRANVKLAEAPSFGLTIFEYAPESNGALDYLHVALEVLDAEKRDPELAGKERKEWQPPVAREREEEAAPAGGREEEEPLVELQPPKSAPESSTRHAPAAPEKSQPTAYRPRSTFRIPWSSHEPVAPSQSQGRGSLHPSSDPPLQPEIEARIEAWRAEEALAMQPPPPNPPAPLPPSLEVEQRQSPAPERTYVLYPSPPPRPLTAGPAADAALELEPRQRARPNDLLSLCLRSLRALWRSD